MKTENLALLTMRWGIANVFVIGLVRFENNVLKEFVYDEDLYNNAQMYLQKPGEKPAMKDCHAVWTILSNIGSMTAATWEQSANTHTHSSVYIRYGSIFQMMTDCSLEETFRKFVG